MWANVKSSIVAANDNPIGAVNAGMDKVLGPSFDYLQTIKSPREKGVSSDGSFDQVSTNIGAVSGYVNNLIVGPKVGNQFFTDTGGYCKGPGGRVVSRYTYTNNQLGGDDAAGILGESFQKAVRGSGFDGIIPGIGGDLASMNPLKIVNGLVLDGIPPCQAFTCPITDPNTGEPLGKDTRFLTPSLENNLTPCENAANQAGYEKAATMNPAPKMKNMFERFANYEPDNRDLQFVKVDYTDPMAYVLWGVALACVVGYIVSK